MSHSLKHPKGNVLITDLSDNKKQIRIDSSAGVFVPIKSCETNYPLSLIQLILEVKGADYLCDEICRDIRWPRPSRFWGAAAARGRATCPGARLSSRGCHRPIAFAQRPAGRCGPAAASARNGRRVARVARKRARRKPRGRRQ